MSNVVPLHARRLAPATDPVLNDLTEAALTPMREVIYWQQVQALREQWTPIGIVPAEDLNDILDRAEKIMIEDLTRLKHALIEVFVQRRMLTPEQAAMLDSEGITLRDYVVNLLEPLRAAAGL